MNPAVDVLTAVSAVLAGIAGCGWIGRTLHQAVFGREERRANAAAAVAGAAKLIVDELQEEVGAARQETRAARQETREARQETAALRREIDELRQLTSREIDRLNHENHGLRLRIANQ